VAGSPTVFFAEILNVENGHCDIGLCNADQTNHFEDKHLEISFVVIKSS
jgi:hypothetical protein